MQIVKEILSGCYVISPHFSEDGRGSFVKTYNVSALLDVGIKMPIMEEYYSYSKKNVIRGMHFQLPPVDHEKMVYCPSGSVLDVVLDLRAGPSYGAMASIELTMTNRYVLYIPRGVAHGFLSLGDNSLMVYKTSSEYNPSLDAGIDFNSFGFDWGVSHPIVSQRDVSHTAFKDFATPF